MNHIDTMFAGIIPEKIPECQFEEMTFNTEMLDIYLRIDGETSLAEIGRQFSIELADIAAYFEVMTGAGIVKVRKIIKTP